MSAKPRPIEEISLFDGKCTDEERTIALRFAAENMRKLVAEKNDPYHRRLLAEMEKELSVSNA